MFTNVTYTVFGWKYHVTLNPKVRSIRNFPMQANGAEIMRSGGLSRRRERNHDLLFGARCGPDHGSARPT
jgi:hypothetical protein